MSTDYLTYRENFSMFKKQLSLCMIVKNEEAKLADALESVRELVDEVIVVDTGSTDKSVQIAQKYGAQLFFFDWCDDFSAARNFSIEQATGEWILVLDADEAIAKRDHDLLRRVIREDLHEAVCFYQRNYFDDPSAENWCINKTDYEEARSYQGYSDVPVVRMFRNHPLIRFEGIVHESVERSLEGLRKHYSDIPIHHFRQDASQAISPEKKEKYLNLLIKEVEKNSDSVKSVFLLGRQLYEFEQYPEAIAYLEHALRLGTKSELVYENLASAYYQCKMFDEAIDILGKLLKFNPRYAEGYATLGLSCYQVGRVHDAINALVQAISLKPTSVRHQFNLAAIFYKEHDFEACESYIKSLVKLCPKYVRAYYLLFHVYFEQERNEEAVEVAMILQNMEETMLLKIKDKLKILENRLKEKVAKEMSATT